MVDLNSITQSVPKKVAFSFFWTAFVPKTRDYGEAGKHFLTNIFYGHIIRIQKHKNTRT